MTKKAINYYGTFNGIYEWGRGFISTFVQFKWDEYWRCVFPNRTRKCHWKTYVKGSGLGECGSLVGTSKAIYMHPMGIYGVFVEGGLSCGCSLPEEDHKYEYKYVFETELNELREICEEAAAYCGGSFTLECSPEFEIEVPDANILISNKVDYLHNCAERIERK